MSVNSMIHRETHEMLSASPEILLKEAVDQMVAKNENAMIVLNKDGSLAGILTDHDVMRALSQNDGELADEQVGNWMSQKVVTCDCNSKLADAMTLMGRHKIRHLVAVENNRPIAVIGIRALLAKLHEIDEMEINVLRDIAVARSA